VPSRLYRASERSASSWKLRTVDKLRSISGGAGDVNIIGFVSASTYSDMILLDVDVYRCKWLWMALVLGRLSRRKDSWQ